MAFFTSNIYTEFTWRANISKGSPDLWKLPGLSVADLLYTPELFPVLFRLFWCATPPIHGQTFNFHICRRKIGQFCVHKTGLLFWHPIYSLKSITLRHSCCDSQGTQTLIYSKPRMQFVSHHFICPEDQQFWQASLHHFLHSQRSIFWL